MRVACHTQTFRPLGRLLGGSRSREHVDLLYVAAGTTAGLRRSDAAFIEAAEKLGVTVASISSDFTLPWRIRRLVWRSLIAIDAFEALSLAFATRRALNHYIPRAVVYGTSHAALVQLRRPRCPVGIRFDTPAQLSRSGAVFRPEHVLERRRFRRARVLLPWGIELDPSVSARIPEATEAIPLPIPIVTNVARRPGQRGAVVVCYAANPEKKGLAQMIRAWSRVDPRGHRLVVTGLDGDGARSYLGSVGVSAPPGVEWKGKIASDDHRALTQTAAIYLAASQYEDYGIAQLEALADGALLVTTRSAGPYAALSLADRLDRRLVADRGQPDSLASALDVALSYSAAERETYQDRAQEMMQAHSMSELSRRLREAVLPALLGETGAYTGPGFAELKPG